MDMNDITKEQVEEMSAEELVYWNSVFEQKTQVEQIRGKMLQFIEVRDEKHRANIIHIDSKVVNNS